VGQERLGPSYFFISLVLGPLNSLLWYVGIPLLSDDHLLRQYLGPLKVLEVNTLIAEFKDEFVGISELLLFWVCVWCDEIYI
jgi:hypothetical protein